MLIKIKCPFCGFVSDKDSSVNSCVCEKCNNTFPTQKGSKFYKSYEKTTNDKTIVAKGEAYLKVDSLLEKGEYYLKNEDFDNAYTTFLEALNLTNTNYKIYMGLVRALTHNFQKLNEKSHEVYLKNAIDCANENQKEIIRNVYKPYYDKNRATKSELEKISTDESNALIDKTRQRLKSCLPKHFSREKTFKLLKILFPITCVLTIAFLLLSFFVYKIAFGVLTIIIGVSMLVIFSKMLSLKTKNDVLNAVLDLYDNLNDLNITIDNKIKILKCINSLAVCYSNNQTDVALVDNLSKVYNEILKCDNEKLEKFISNYNIYDKCSVIEN